MYPLTSLLIYLTRTPAVVTDQPQCRKPLSRHILTRSDSRFTAYTFLIFAPVQLMPYFLPSVATAEPKKAFQSTKTRLTAAALSDVLPDHFSNAHGKAGLVLTIFVMLQVVAAVFRPSKPPAGALVQDANGQRVRDREGETGRQTLSSELFACSFVENTPCCLRQCG